MPYRRNQGPNTSRRARLVGFDYHSPGYYFVTICQKDRHHFFGNITNLTQVLSESGLMIDRATDEIPGRFPGTQLDAYIVMPNHVHLLIGLSLGGDSQNDSVSLIDVIHWWKTITTNRYITGVKNHGWPRFEGSLWQTGYHDRIVRTEKELEILRKYITENPQRWEADTFYPVGV